MSTGLDTFISILIFFITILLVRCCLNRAAENEQETQQERTGRDHAG